MELSRKNRAMLSSHSLGAKLMDDCGLPLDSKEGMEILVRCAKAGGYVLSEFHERLMAKHGISIEGVTISRQLLLSESLTAFRFVLIFGC
jgi:hypothetical protein